MLYEKETTQSVDEVISKLEQAAKDRKFGVLSVHDLKAKMAEKGVEFGPECRVLEVCNPGQAKIVLEADLTISNALPCRIAVYQQDGKVKVSTLLPTQLLGLFKRPELELVAKEVEETMLEIIDEACG